jgi:hypothetical protein
LRLESCCVHQKRLVSRSFTVDATDPYYYRMTAHAAGALDIRSALDGFKIRMLTIKVAHDGVCSKVNGGKARLWKPSTA